MPLIPEPIVKDETWGQRGEPPLSWIRRSTLPLAGAARLFLNRNLARLPEDAQSKLLAALHTRWDSAFFELVVARTLQLLGGEICVELETEAGPRVDFSARFGQQIANVEAISPVTDAPAGDIVKSRNPLLDILESHVPDGWSVGVISLPDIGLSDSKKQFSQVVKKLPERISDRNDVFEIVEDMPKGRLHLKVWPDSPAGLKIVHEAPIPVWDDTESRIRNAVRTKKRQARAAEGPVLVAIHIGGITGGLEDFDLALFGRSVMVLDASRTHVATRFEADGVFATRRPEPPVIDGILAFIRVGFRSFPEPVL